VHQQIDNSVVANYAEIAAREGISRARVTQIMNLLRLPPEIQDELQPPPAPLEIHAFSERRLRSLLSLRDRETQVDQWRHWVQGLLST
jgi:hypothetical protein